MARRCEFLEKCAGFYLNGGLGSGLQTNSVLLGSTLIEVMIQEAVRMSENFDYQHSRKNIMQVCSFPSSSRTSNNNRRHRYTLRDEPPSNSSHGGRCLIHCAYSQSACMLVSMYVLISKAKNNGCSATKFTTQSTKWPPSSMKGAILYLPRSILAHCGYAEVNL